MFFKRISSHKYQGLQRQYDYKLIAIWRQIDRLTTTDWSLQVYRLISYNDKLMVHNDMSF